MEVVSKQKRKERMRERRNGNNYLSVRWPSAAGDGGEMIPRAREYRTMLICGDTSYPTASVGKARLQCPIASHQLASGDNKSHLHSQTRQAILLQGPKRAKRSCCEHETIVRKQRRKPRPEIRRHTHLDRRIVASLDTPLSSVADTSTVCLRMTFTDGATSPAFTRLPPAGPDLTARAL